GETETGARDLLLENVERRDLLAAQKLRREVERVLRDIGLDLAQPEPDLDLDRIEFQDHLDALTIGARDAAVEAVVSILGCSRSGSYRGNITATTAAALRHLGYDRAFFVKWIRDRGRVAVRAKADLSARRIGIPCVDLTAPESAAFEQALQ